MTGKHFPGEDYHNHGISFAYPPAWELEESGTPEAITITLSTGQTGFWSITIMPDRPRPEDVMKTSLEAFQESYPELDRYPSTGKLAGQPFLKEEIEFVCHDLINTAELTTLRNGRVTVLIMCQYYDREEDELKPLFDAITDSLEFDQGDDVVIV